MLQASEPLSLESAATQETSFRELAHWAIAIVWRQLLVIALIGAMGTSLGAFYILMAPSNYTAESRIMIDPRRVQLFPKATFSESQFDWSALDSEIELVKSEPVILQVINSLGLAKDPEFLNSPGVLGQLLGFASPLFSLVKPTKPLSESEARKVALTVLSKNLWVSRVGGSYHLSIQYRSGNPERAVQIANAIAESYVSKQLEVKYEPTKRATEWLEGRIKELNVKQKLAERLVSDFKKNNNVITADGKLMNAQLIAELRFQVSRAKQRTSEAKARLDRTDVLIRDAQISTVADMGTVADTLRQQAGASLGDTANSPVASQLRVRYLNLVNREASWSRKYGANHGAVVNIREQIREIQESFLAELKRLRDTYVNTYEVVKAEEQDLQKRLDDAISQSRPLNQAQVAAQVTLFELESDAKNLRTMSDDFRQRYEDSLQQQSFPNSDASVFARAALPLEKSGPKKALILVMASAGGLGFGLAVGFLRELMKGFFYTREQVESVLQTPCIAVVPSLKSNKGPTSMENPKPMLSFDRGLGAGLNDQRTLSRGPDIYWAVLNSPFSRFAEAMRSIKLAVDLNSGFVNSKKVIGFTSSLPQEGKSTIVASLALLMAQAGARVILVDCDLRNPSLSRRLAPNADHGIIG